MEEGFITDSLNKEGMEMDKRMKPSKIEEALEIKALRRIISAYLNYSDAAEEDVKRWERSYTKLLPQHKALVPHLPEKYQRLRRCIATNSFFLLNMLQAFEPPFDMSKDEDAEIHESYNYSHVPQSADKQLEDKFFEVHDTVNAYAKGREPNHVSEEQYLFPKEPFHTHENLNTSLQQLSSRNSRSKEMTSVVANVQSERNFSANHDLISFMENDNKLSAGICDESKSTSVPTDNHDSMATDKDDASDRTCESLMCDHVQSCSSCRIVPKVSGDREREVSSQQSTSHSVPVPNGEANCISFDWRDPVFQIRVSPADVDKVRCILRNIVRDWAPEGAIERKQCYEPILEELQLHFPNRSKDRPPSCLVPGAGLARLALDISRLGFVSQGNEFSYYMMICSSFILNHTQAPMEWVIYPWIHSNCNSLSAEDQLRPVYFPDLHPGSAGITEGFSMCAGDFVEVYGDPSQLGTWDAVATCFFIDTAHNIIEYIEIISHILKDGGVWINLGPLLYHFADVYSPEDEMSIELSLEEVKAIAFNYGFELETQRTIETTYTANSRSMMQNRYFAAFWTMIKKGSSAKCVSARET